MPVELILELWMIHLWIASGLSNFTAEPDWEFTKGLVDAEAVEKKDMVLECEVSEPEADVKWFKGDQVGEMNHR